MNNSLSSRRHTEKKRKKAATHCKTVEHLEGCCKVAGEAARVDVLLTSEEHNGRGALTEA